MNNLSPFIGKASNVNNFQPAVLYYIDNSASYDYFAGKNGDFELWVNEVNVVDWEESIISGSVRLSHVSKDGDYSVNTTVSSTTPVRTKAKVQVKFSEGTPLRLDDIVIEDFSSLESYSVKAKFSVIKDGQVREDIVSCIKEPRWPFFSSVLILSSIVDDVYVRVMILNFTATNQIDSAYVGIGYAQYISLIWIGSAIISVISFLFIGISLKELLKEGQEIKIVG